MANGEQQRNDWAVLPPWVRAIAVVGIPGVIAIFLVWTVASDLPNISRNVEQVRVEVLANRELLKQQNVRTEAHFRLLQRICSNTARDAYERQRCFD